MADPRELELKLEFDPSDREGLEGALPVKTALAETRRLVSTYFDTPEEDLRRAGYSLRVRQNGGQRIQTVKAFRGSAAGLFARAEWERPIKGNRPLFDDEVGPLVEALGASVLGRVEAIFVTDVKRTIHQIDSASARIELAIDEGEVRAGVRSERISEIELELREGSPQLLFDLAKQLSERAPLRIGVRSKAERGYALAAEKPSEASKAEPITLDHNGDAEAAFCAIAQACVRHFRLNEALLLESGDAETLHQARVGLRRLRCAFSLHKRLLSNDRKAELLRAELRWLAAELGDVRNIDVLIPRCDGDARDRLLAARERTFEHVRTELASARTRLLMIDLTEWLAVGAWRTRPAHPARLRQKVSPFARDLLDRRRDLLKRRGKGLAGLDDGHRHRARIEIKKLRYAAEFFGPLYTSSKRRAQHRHCLEAIEPLQDLLGELNDLVMGPRVLAKLGIDAPLPHCGKRKRKRLLERAEAAYHALIGAKCFWGVR